MTAHGTPVSGPGATAKWKRCGTEARVLLGGACAALASTFLGPSSPQHGARLPAWPRVWSPAPPPDMSPRDPDPGCFPGELPGGPGALGRMIVTGQTAETSPSLGRDEKATGWWDGRRSWQHRWLRSKGPIVNCSAGLEQTHPPWAAGALLLVGRVQASHTSCLPHSPPNHLPQPVLHTCSPPTKLLTNPSWHPPPHPQTLLCCPHAQPTPHTASHALALWASARTSRAVSTML